MNSRASDDEPASGSHSDVREGRMKSRFLLFELFVVISLSVAYFFLVRNFIIAGDPMNRYIFTAGSEKVYRLDRPIICDAWKGRLAGLLSGTLIDLTLNNEHNYSPELKERWSNVFGLYHAFWLLVLFIVVIFALRHSLFINLGIFAGLIYNFSPVSGPYFYPWDMPAMLFFTLAVLFFERRRMWLMATEICVGCFFKETVLVCALLVLFASHWKWGKRLLTFVGIIAVYVLGKKLLLSQLHLDAAALSMGNAKNLLDLFRPVTLIGNVKFLVSPTLNHLVFANAGTLAAVLVLCWRKRFVPYMTVILVFLGGQLLYAWVNEFRVFMDVLPLSLILLSELWQEHAESGAVGGLSAEAAGAWAVRETFPVLIPITITLIVLSIGIAARQYYIIFADLRQPQSQLGNYELKLVELNPELLRKGYADAEFELAKISADKHQFSETIHYLKRVVVLDTNSVSALNNLAFLLATATDASLRNGKEAVRLAEQACQQTHYKKVVEMRTLAAAYAEAGRFDDAVATAQKVLAMVLAEGPKELAAQDEKLLELYKSGHAYHQEDKTVP